MEELKAGTTVILKTLTKDDSFISIFPIMQNQKMTLGEDGHWRFEDKEVYKQMHYDNTHGFYFAEGFGYELVSDEEEPKKEEK